MKRERFLACDKYGVSFCEDNNRIELARKICAEIKPASLLDVGCGDGGFLQIIRQLLPGCRVAGLETSEAASAIAVKRGLDVRRQDLENSEWPPPNSFQMCFAGEVIEHLFSPDDFLAEVFRVLEPGGYLLLTTPNLAAWFNRVSLLFGYQPIHTEVGTRANYGHILPLPGTPAGHIRLFTLRALRELVAASGFTVVRIYGVGQNVPRTRIACLRLAAPLLNLIFSHPSLASGLALLAQKKVVS
ncbi:MAG: class I SAM-dependent methyltransferase [Verrucomicrobia bacterium]|nr:class I SAM-dependent methyltransferase [Verrucomicrobiota bacterium]